jgi:hypothetical protein
VFPEETVAEPGELAGLLVADVAGGQQGVADNLDLGQLYSSLR